MISETARSAAVFRAAHMLVDASPHIFEDPFARALSGYEDDQTFLEAFNKRPAHIQQARGLFAVRSRFTEDALRQAAERGLQQYVILGAGADSFGLRSAEEPIVDNVFEVDQQGTQDWKRARIDSLGWKVPASVRYVPFDLTSDSLWTELLRAGLDQRSPVFFSCLGVTQYLSPETNPLLLDQIAFAAAGSELVIQYQEPITEAPDEDQQMLRYFVEASARLGEPWRSFFSTGTMRSMLQERGFRPVEHLDGEEAKRRYLAGRVDGVTVPTYLHILRASS